MKFNKSISDKLNSDFPNKDINIRYELGEYLKGELVVLVNNKKIVLDDEIEDRLDEFVRDRGDYTGKIYDLLKNYIDLKIV